MSGEISIQRFRSDLVHTTQEQTGKLTHEQKQDLSNLKAQLEEQKKNNPAIKDISDIKIWYKGNQPFFQFKVKVDLGDNQEHTFLVNIDSERAKDFFPGKATSPERAQQLLGELVPNVQKMALDVGIDSIRIEGNKITVKPTYGQERTFTVSSLNRKNIKRYKTLSNQLGYVNLRLEKENNKFFPNKKLIESLTHERDDLINKLKELGTTIETSAAKTETIYNSTTAAKQFANVNNIREGAKPGNIEVFKKQAEQLDPRMKMELLGDPARLAALSPEQLKAMDFSDLTSLPLDFNLSNIIDGYKKLVREGVIKSEEASERLSILIGKLSENSTIRESLHKELDKLSAQDKKIISTLHFSEIHPDTVYELCCIAKYEGIRLTTGCVVINPKYFSNLETTGDKYNFMIFVDKFADQFRENRYLNKALNLSEFRNVQGYKDLIGKKEEVWDNIFKIYGYKKNDALYYRVQDRVNDNEYENIKNKIEEKKAPPTSTAAAGPQQAPVQPKRPRAESRDDMNKFLQSTIPFSELNNYFLKQGQFKDNNPIPFQELGANQINMIQKKMESADIGYIQNLNISMLEKLLCNHAPVDPQHRSAIEDFCLSLIGKLSATQKANLRDLYRAGRMSYDLPKNEGTGRIAAALGITFL